MGDPGIPVNCPTCGVPMVYRTSFDDKHLYRCKIHSHMVLFTDGSVRPFPTDGYLPATHPRTWSTVGIVDAGKPFPLETRCPLCGAAMPWQRTDNGPVYVFRCDRHGLVVLGTNGRFELMPQ